MLLLTKMIYDPSSKKKELYLKLILKYEHVVTTGNHEHVVITGKCELVGYSSRVLIYRHYPKQSGMLSSVTILITIAKLSNVTGES